MLLAPFPSKHPFQAPGDVNGDHDICDGDLLTEEEAAGTRSRRFGRGEVAFKDCK